MEKEQEGGAIIGVVMEKGQEWKKKAGKRSKDRKRTGKGSKDGKRAAKENTDGRRT